MKKTMVPALAFLLCGSASLFAQAQSSDPSQQDVPQQQQPGTNNPDVGKQRRSTPTPSPKAGNAHTPTPDAPQQQPATNNPDVGKQRQDSNAGTTGGASSGSGQSGAKKKGKSKATHSDSQ